METVISLQGCEFVIPPGHNPIILSLSKRFHPDHSQLFPYLIFMPILAESLGFNHIIDLITNFLVCTHNIYDQYYLLLNVHKMFQIVG